MTKSLDKRFRHVGRIKRSWGTTHKPTIRRMEEMMQGLFERGRLDILRAIRDKTYTPLEVYDAWRTNELERLPTAATLAPLKEAFEKWLAKKECSEAHRRSLSQSLRHLIGKRSRSTVEEVPTLLLSLRETMRASHPRSFNLARAAAQAFAKTTAGRNSKLWQDITAVEVLKVTPQRTKHPMTPTELFEITGRMMPHLADIALGMAGSGMGPTEFWGDWEMTGANGIAIHGTKRKGRERIVPLVILVTPPKVLYPAFRRALAKAGDIRPYDLRRTYANFLESAGIPRTRRRLYMGHGAGDVTDLYEWQQVEAFLAEDAEKLRTYIFGSAGSKLRLERA